MEQGQAVPRSSGTEDTKQLAIRLKRIYEPPEPNDGYRLLVDRLWPRGISKAGAQIDRWMRDVAPSAELRHWFGHDISRWQEFKQRYALELDVRKDLVAEILCLARDRSVTLIYSARDAEHNQAVALAEYLRAEPRRRTNA